MSGAGHRQDELEVFVVSDSKEVTRAAGHQLKETEPRRRAPKPGQRRAPNWGSLSNSGLPSVTAVVWNITYLKQTQEEGKLFCCFWRVLGVRDSMFVSLSNLYVEILNAQSGGLAQGKEQWETRAPFCLGPWEAALGALPRPLALWSGSPWKTGARKEEHSSERSSDVFWRQLPGMSPRGWVSPQEGL